MKIFALLIAAASALDCDEAPLLQVNERFPDLDNLMKGVSDIVDKTREVASQGIGKITGEMEDGLGKAEQQLDLVSSKFSGSMQTFNQSINAGDSVAANLTKFKKLVDETMTPVMPTYKEVLKQVSGTVNSTRAVLATMGQTELVGKLDGALGTATEKLGMMADTTQQLTSDVSSATSANLGETLDKVDSLLSILQEQAADFRSSFDERVAEFTSALQVPLSLALGDEAPKQLEALTSKADELVEKFQNLTQLFNTELQRAGGSVDSELQVAREWRQKPFFQKIFGGIFGR